MRKWALKRSTDVPTESKHPQIRIYPFLLRNPDIDRPNQVWATDAGLLPMARGFVYLVAVMDWYSTPGLELVDLQA